MVQPKSVVALNEVKGILQQNKEFLKDIVQELLQETPEAEIHEILQM